MSFPGRARLWALAVLIAPAAAAAAPGSTSPDFLRVSPAPRPAAMGESFVGLADDVNAIAYNPGGLGFIERQEIALMHNQYISGVTQEYVAYALPTHKVGTFALSANLLRVEPFKAFDPNDQPIGEVSADDLALSGAYALSWRGLSLGGAGKHIRSRLAEKTARGVAYDAGALVRFRWGFSFGYSILNMGKGLIYERERAPLPRTQLGGVAWKGPFLWPGSQAAVTTQASFPVDRKAYFSAGSEVWLTPMIALRFGYRGSQEDDLKFGWGAGFKIPLRRWSSPGRAWAEPTWEVRYDRAETKLPAELEIDYAFVKLGDLGTTHRIALLLRFGRGVPPESSPAWRQGYEPSVD
ncbi:MAG: PorV/PorQ family protein [Elusimicrobia bacterium]|nr:PorV/PorQ family protein [Elusimicrobiota bacterium]